jgi:phospholipid-binding lipoprotein MlaA
MKDSMKRRLMGAALAAMVLTSSACSTPPTDPDARAAYDEANDPWEPFNRYIFDVNYALDQLFFRPIAGMYRTGVPEPLRDAIRNFLRNLRSPLILIHDLLQGELDRAGVTLQRFALNSTLGVGGFIDFADDVLELQYHDEDFGQTLGVWGFEEGWYIMLPFYGPSNPRDTTGIIVDSFIDPVSVMLRVYGPSYGPQVRSVLTALDARSRAIDALDEVERTSIDFYATIRSLYRQRRDDEIRQGRPSGNQGAPTIMGDGGQASPFIENASPQRAAPGAVQGAVVPRPMMPTPLPRLRPKDQISQRPQ